MSVRDAETTEAAVVERTRRPRSCRAGCTAGSAWRFSPG